MSKDKKNKQLTLTDVNKLHREEFGNQKEIELKNGKTLKIDIKFRKSKMQDMILEYTDLLNDLYKNDVTTDSVKDIVFIYHMLVIRHFTNFQVPKNIRKMSAICEKLLDLGILDEILNSFDENELKKLDDYIQENLKMSKAGNVMGDIFIKGFINENKGNGNIEQIIQQP